VFHYQLIQGPSTDLFVTILISDWSLGRNGACPALGTQGSVTQVCHL
jgi:hypothetical protein